MPKLLDHILPLYNVLKGIDPSLPRALFVALVFLTVLAWRKLSPGSWKTFSNVIPVSEADTNWFKATMLKVWQALPSALLGAVYGALGTGGDIVASLKLAALALLAPVVHEVAWRYQGNLGTKKSPPPSGENKPAGAVDEVFPQDMNGNPLSIRSLEFSLWHSPAWRFAPLFGLLAIWFGLVLGLSGCAAPKLPCNEDKMKALDVAFVKDLTKVCLQYPNVKDCPDYLPLKAKHDAALESCPQ